MPAQEHGLGRGLDLLFSGGRHSEKNTPFLGEHMEEVPSLPSVTKLPIASLRPNKSQPRKNFEGQPLQELAESIKSQGIVQPILVRPCKSGVSVSYEIVAGERRWRAAKIAGLMDIPVYVKEFSDEEVMIVSLVENIQREDLDPIEEALAIQVLWTRLSVSQEDLALKLGKSRSAVANSLRLLQLPRIIQKSLQEKKLSPGHARALLAVTDEAVQDRLYRSIVEKQLSVRDSEAAVNHWKQHGILPAGIMGESTSRKQRAPQTEEIKILLKQLKNAVHPKVTMSGDENMGRITVPYETHEQLEQVLKIFGVTYKEII